MLVTRVARSSRGSANIDTLFLFIRKAQVGIDCQKREAAASLLVILLHVYVAMQSQTAGAVNKSRHNSDMIEEIQGYIRKCLQQQQSVRVRVYHSLVEMVRESHEKGPENLSCGNVVAHILSRQLSKYLIFHEEESENARIRQNISSRENIIECGDLPAPLRLLSCLSVAPAKGTSSERQTRKASVLSGALERVKEPLPQLFQCCLLVANAKASVSDSPNVLELRRTLSRILLRIADSNLHCYLLDLEEMASSGSFKNNAKAKHETELAIMIVLLSTVEVLMEGSTILLQNKEENDDEWQVNTQQYDVVLNKLWCLYCAAKERATLLVAGANKTGSKKSKDGKKRPKGKNTGERCDEPLEEPESAAEKGLCDIAPASLEKAKVQLEDSLRSICWPIWTESPTLLFLESAFTKYGTMSLTSFWDSKVCCIT